MKLNADFSKRAVVKAAETDWIASPMPGVSRKMLDRIGDEVARATTIVRYAPGSHFSAHTHDGGEEFIVLDGVFQDESGDFPAGSYVRNPPTSSHTPGSEFGATILVKLHQFAPDDRTHIRIATQKNSFVAAEGRPGVSVMPLFEDAREAVRLERWAPEAELRVDAVGGLELFVLDGGVTEGSDSLGAWDWLRLPDGATLQAVSGPQGARVWIKTGHLRGLA
ncbi:MAG: cupin domain-containing protein [Pikeienuella sp.]